MIDLSTYETPRWVWWLVGLYFLTPVLLYIVVPFLFHEGKSTKKRILICVLGELGHSPRMIYHARSFSSNNFQVELCGYVDKDIPEDVANDENIQIHGLKKIEGNGGLITKAIRQTLELVSMFWKLRAVDYILLQNPPSIPVLPLAVVFRVLTRSKLIVDWHNLGYSILQLKFDGRFGHPLVLLAFFIEYIFSKFADYNITVTVAMKKYLVNRFGLKESLVCVLYDRPGNQFSPLQTSRSEALKESFVSGLLPDDFDFERDKIFVTSTSFTPDEDLSLLIGALKIYENSCIKFDNTLPKIVCFITGKGPLKEKVKRQVETFQWNRVHIKFLWLSADDYPKLLRLCDYGVSLHTSSSGLDLPMKVLDMFGSGLPVICMNYPTLEELVQQNVNGLKFADRRELHEALIFCIKDESVFKRIKSGALAESENKWEQSWENAMSTLKIIHK